MHVLRAVILSVFVALALIPTASAHPYDFVNAVRQDVEECTNDLECDPNQILMCLGRPACNPASEYAICPEYNDDWNNRPMGPPVYLNTDCDPL